MNKSANNFTIIAYSFGCTVALEIALLLEKEGLVGRIIFIDGSPKYSKDVMHKLLDSKDDENAKVNVLSFMVASNCPLKTLNEYKVPNQVNN